MSLSFVSRVLPISRVNYQIKQPIVPSFRLFRHKWNQVITTTSIDKRNKRIPNSDHVSIDTVCLMENGKNMIRENYIFLFFLWHICEYDCFGFFNFNKYTHGMHRKLNFIKNAIAMWDTRTRTHTQIHSHTKMDEKLFFPSFFESPLNVMHSLSHWTRAVLLAARKDFRMHTLAKLEREIVNLVSLK